MFYVVDYLLIFVGSLQYDYKSYLIFFVVSLVLKLRLTNMIQSLLGAYFRHTVLSFCWDFMGMVYLTLIRMFVVHPRLQMSPQTMQMNKLSKQTNVCGGFWC